MVRLTRFRALVFVTLISLCCGPLQAALITVNSLADTVDAADGLCTLREAIVSANADAASGVPTGECAAGSGADDIAFGVAGTLQPASALPDITTVMHIDGYTAPGASRNTLPLEKGTDAVLVVEIDGVNAGNVSGLKLTGAGASGSIIEGLVINNSANPVCCAQIGIFLESVNGVATTVLRGNFIGTDITGSARRPKGARGIYMTGAANVVIGSDTGGDVDPAAVNLLSGNNGPGVGGAGISNLRIRGNLVGTDASGTASLFNVQSGIALDALTMAWIEDNVLSGNNQSGFYMRATSASVQVARNIIGRDASGANALPNGFGGIHISENPNTVPVSITNVDLVDNLIADNNCGADCAAVLIGENNSANTVQGVRLAGNRIFSNQGLEIDLAETNAMDFGVVVGVTANDPDDADSGANTLQNFPVVTNVVADGVNVSIGFVLNSEAAKPFTLEFFHTTACDPSGHGGAETVLGTSLVNTDGAGHAAGQAILPLSAVDGFITATATHDDNGTSEFSPCAAVQTNSLFHDGFEDLAP